MALRHFDGFTAYNAVGDLSASGLYVVSDPVNNLLVIPDGGSMNQGALRFGVSSLAEASIYKAITDSNHVMVGFWFDFIGFDSYSDLSDVFFTLHSSTTLICDIAITSIGALIIRVNGGGQTIFNSSVAENSPSGTDVNLLTIGSHRIELRFNSNSTLGEIELVVDGKIWCQMTSNTLYGYDINRVYFRTGWIGSGAKFEIDSLYVFDDTGTYNNALLGDWQCQVLRPAGDYGTPQFTIASAPTVLIAPTTITPQTGDIAIDGIAPQVAEPGIEVRVPDAAALSMNGYAPTVTMSSRNWEEVNDGVFHDADGTHTYSTSNAQIDKFSTTDTLEGLICRVQAVNVCCVARRDDSAAQNFRTMVTHGASTTSGANVALNAAEWKPVIQTYAANPSTGTQWLDSEVEEAKFGYESRA